MKIAVVGLGAVGGLMAARLAAAGHEVSALTRGAALAAVRAQGLRSTTDGHQAVTRVAASNDVAALGPQELVIVSLKGPALGRAAASINALLELGTLVLPAMNGVPWWFLKAAPASIRLTDRTLKSVDPQGRIDALLPLGQVIGCVVHLSCASPEPGRVQQGSGNRLIVGESFGGTSGRVERNRAKSASQSHVGSARSKPRCCRIHSPADRSRSTHSSARCTK